MHVSSISQVEGGLHLKGREPKWPIGIKTTETGNDENVDYKGGNIASINPLKINTRQREMRYLLERSPHQQTRAFENVGGLNKHTEKTVSRSNGGSNTFLTS